MIVFRARICVVLVYERFLITIVNDRLGREFRAEQLNNFPFGVTNNPGPDHATTRGKGISAVKS